MFFKNNLFVCNGGWKYVIWNIIKFRLIGSSIKFCGNLEGVLILIDRLLWKKKFISCDIDLIFVMFR